ncbi:MAG: hypothetical protein MJ252_07960 [archaeon]|nr:hypothetical protein [archaeon]
MSSNKKDDKKEKPKATVKLEWIFGMRKDIFPNVILMDDKTIIYPASNYLITYNFRSDTEFEHSTPYHFIEGHPHSKGFTAMAKKSGGIKTFVAVEETKENTYLHYYTLSSRGGMTNLPELQQKIELPKKEGSTERMMNICLSDREGKENFLIGLKCTQTAKQAPGTNTKNQEPTYINEYSFYSKILENKDAKDNFYSIKDFPEKAKGCKNFSMSFSTLVMTSDQDDAEFCVCCENIICFYCIKEKNNVFTEITPSCTRSFDPLEYEEKEEERENRLLQEKEEEENGGSESADENKEEENGENPENGENGEENPENGENGEKNVENKEQNPEENKEQNPEENKEENPVNHEDENGQEKKPEDEKKEEEEEKKEETEEERMLREAEEKRIKAENEEKERQKKIKQEMHSILSHCWLNDGILVILTKQKIYLTRKRKPTAEDDLDVFQKIENKDGYTLVTPFVSSIQDGFIAAGPKGIFHVWLRKIDPNMKVHEGSEESSSSDEDEDKEGDREEFTKKLVKENYDFVPGINEPINSDKQPGSKNSIQSEKTLDFHTVCCIDGGKEVIATTMNNDLIKIKIDAKSINREPMEYVVTPFHGDSIVGMDCCINKPYLITCSKDKTVKVWDYVKHIQLISKSFDEDLYSIAFHPSGMHALVSLEDKLYTLAIFYDGIEFRKNQNVQIKCRSNDIKFSNLGHLFAFDSGTNVNIYDFMNMVPFAAPANYQHTKSLNNSTSRINCLSWSSLDKHLLIGCQDLFFNWKLKEDTFPSSKEKDPKNFVSVIFDDKKGQFIAAADDNSLITIQERVENPPKIIKLGDYSIKELTLLPESDILFCSTFEKNIKDKNSSNQQQKSDSVLSEGFTTSCLRMYPDKNNFKNAKDTDVYKEFTDFPSHVGNTTRVRVNYEGTKIFTCGEDGCINVYSVDVPTDIYSENITLGTGCKFTPTVLIDKASNKTRETNKKDLPAKKEDQLKKAKTENSEGRDQSNRTLKDWETKIRLLASQEQSQISEMDKQYNRNIQIYEDRLISKAKENKEKEDNEKNKNQLDIAEKTRQVDNLREEKRKIAEDAHERKKENERINKEILEEIQRKHEEEKTGLERTKKELEDNIKKVEEDEIKDGNALDEVNKKIVSKISSNVEQLKAKIDELVNHYGHDLKKKKKEKEKLEEDVQALKDETKKMGEDHDSQKEKQAALQAEKAEVEKEMLKVTKRISDIENKIIECKKSHTYLEKCKFVLSYKIQELKKETGPMEKVLEDLQKRTKEDELSLAKYNREFALINLKMVNLKQLQRNAKKLENDERLARNNINNFKIDLHNMLADIDDFEKLKMDFYLLRKKYCEGYEQEEPNHELEGEFENQKSKMKNRVLELQQDLINLKNKHKENITTNRDENSLMIKNIRNLKKSIKESKKAKEVFCGDVKHANAVAEIKAGEYVKNLMMKEISMTEKIQMFRERLNAKKSELRELKAKVHVTDNDGRPIDEEGNIILEGYIPEEE